MSLPLITPLRSTSPRFASQTIVQRILSRCSGVGPSGNLEITAPARRLSGVRIARLAGRMVVAKTGARRSDENAEAFIDARTFRVGMWRGTVTCSPDG